jgi:putative transposase
VGGREGADRPGDLRAGNVGVGGGTAPRDRAEPAIHLAAALCQGALSAVGAVEEVVAASEYRMSQHRCELQRAARQQDYGERDPARGAGSGATKKTAVARPLLRSGRYAIKTVADTLGVACSNLAAPAAHASRSRRGRRPQPDADLLAEITHVIAGMPTYGYRRVHALIRRRRAQQAVTAVNVKRVYRVMKAHGLLLERHGGAGAERRHDGRVAVDRPDQRWCSDGFEIGCDNGERVRVAFTPEGCDREAIAWVAKTAGIQGGDIRDLMVETVEHRFGLVNRLPVPIEWLSDNGSPYLAGETRKLARDIGLLPCTTPIESPQSNSMAEAFVKTIKRDYARVNPRPDARVFARLEALEQALAQLKLYLEELLEQETGRNGALTQMTEELRRLRKDLDL